MDKTDSNTLVDFTFILVGMGFVAIPLYFIVQFVATNYTAIISRSEWLGHILAIIMFLMVFLYGIALIMTLCVVVELFFIQIREVLKARK